MHRTRSLQAAWSSFGICGTRRQLKNSSGFSKSTPVMSNSKSTCNKTHEKPVYKDLGCRPKKPKLDTPG